MGFGITEIHVESRAKSIVGNIKTIVFNRPSAMEHKRREGVGHVHSPALQPADGTSRILRDGRGGASGAHGG